MLRINREIYVVVTERDTKERNLMNNGPIVMQTYVSRATRENAERRIRNLKGQLGECRIAKLVFMDDAEGDAEDAQDSDTAYRLREYREDENGTDGNHKVVRRFRSRSGFRPDSGSLIAPISA